MPMKNNSKTALPKLAALGMAVLVPGGCAKGPSGGAVTPSANRLAVTMRLQQPLNNGYVYSFAFDDDDDSSDGPVAIVASTNLTNGIVAGAFTVLVEYQGGAYTVYRRTEGPGGTTETLDRAVNPFVTAPSPATGDTIAFTLNLDATTTSGARLFRAGVQRLDINFVTANERRRDPSDNLRKAFDAFGPGTANNYATFDIRSTRDYTNAATVNEGSGDVVTNDTSGAINLNQLDIVDFALSVSRS